MVQIDLSETWFVLTLSLAGFCGKIHKNSSRREDQGKNRAKTWVKPGAMVKAWGEDCDISLVYMGQLGSRASAVNCPIAYLIWRLPPRYLTGQ
jgi:hypothetical protein